MEEGKLYMDARGFIYECIQYSVDDPFDVKEVVLKCWNSNDPKDYGRVFHQYVDSPLIQALDEVNYDYLESIVAMQKTSIRYHMREAQHQRDANIRFNKELKERRESRNR